MPRLQNKVQRRITIKARLQNKEADGQHRYIKTILLPRDAVHKRGLCRHAVFVRLSARLSVCVFVTFVDHVKTNKHIVEIFHHLVATPFSFFNTKRGGDIPTGTPSPP